MHVKIRRGGAHGMDRAAAGDLVDCRHPGDGRRHGGRVIAAVALAVTTALVPVMIGASPASAAVVPNNYNCSRWTGKCVQINGPHVNGLPNACHWVWSVYTSGSPTSICSYWY
jgi:hypothetical protein